MINCVCFLQEGQIPDRAVKRLAQGIQDIVTEHQLGTEVNVAWINVPKGQGWTAGAPSTSSVVTLTKPPIKQQTRVNVLHDLCELWSETTGCEIDEVLATVMPRT